MVHAFHVRRIIQNYVEKHGVTVLLSSHNMLEVEFLCNRVALINEGKREEPSQPIIGAKAAFTGDYLTMLTSIAYISLFTVAILYIAAKIFTTERVVTARISLKRMRLKR